MGSGEHLETAAAFDAAALDSAEWPKALGRLASATGSNRAELIGIGVGSLAFCISDMPAELYREFDEVVGYSPRANPRVAAGLKAAPMEVVGDREYDQALSAARTKTYRDCVAVLDIPHGCQTTLLRQAGRLIGMSVLRTAKQGRIGPDDTATFAAVAPRALAAVRTRLMLGERSVRDVVAGLEHAGVAAFLCDRDGQVRNQTGSAEALLAEQRLVRLRDGRLAAADPAQDSTLQRRFAAVEDGAATADAVLLDPAGRRAAVHLRALPKHDWGAAFQPQVLVVVRERPRQPDAEVLRLAFGLTAAEAQVVLALADGLPREAVAARRGVTLGTLRQQLKSIFAKVGVSREAELVLAALALG